MGKLPEGYEVVSTNDPERVFDPDWLMLRRDDGSPVGNFPPRHLTAIEWAAWRDYRERTLRVIEGEK